MRVRSYAVVLALYTVAALLLTWPLLAHFATHVPGDGIDDPSLAWNLWWIKSRLVDQVNLDIFHVDWMFHPIAINLGFYTLTPLNGLLSIPLQSAFTLIIANNLILLSSFIIGGFGAYLLTLQELPTRHSLLPTRHFSSFFAGFIYAFASSKLFYVSLGQFNIASSQWIPFCALYLLRLGRATEWRNALRNALLAGLFLTLQAWAELTYASFLIIFAALVFLWSIAIRNYAPGGPPRITNHESRGGPPGAQHESRITNQAKLLWLRITGFICLAVVFAIGIAPFLWAMVPDLVREGDFFASGGGFADEFSADLAGYWLPTRLHPWFGDWVIGLSFPNDKGQQIFIGYSVMLLAIFGMQHLTGFRQPLQGKPVRSAKQQRWTGSFWLVATIFFGWMTLGAQVRWLGEPLSIPGPFALISRLPFFSGNRYPSRYSVMLILCVAVLAGAGLQALVGVGQRWMRDKEIGRLRDWMTARPKGTRSITQSPNLSSSQSPNLFIPLSLTVIFLALFLLEHLSLPLPLSDFRTPPIYQRLAAEPGDFTLLELPTGWRNGARVLGKSDILIMMQQWYQTTHGKRRLGGNTSRNPPYKFQYFTDAPLLGDLIALMNAEPASNPANDEIAGVVEKKLDAIIARDRPLAGQVLAFLGVKYVTVHVNKSPPALLRFVEEALPLTLVEEWHGPDWSGADSTIRLYTVNTITEPDWVINLAGPEGQLHLAEGWSSLATDGVRYATRPCADLLLNLPAKGGTLRIQLLGLPQSARLSVNGLALATLNLPTDDKGSIVQVHASQATELIDRLQLCFDRRTALADLVPPTDPQGWPIGNTGSFSKQSIVVQSAGKDVGDFAHIWVNGVDVARHQVGYNLVALDGAGAILANQAFDTLASLAEAQAMSEWLDQWPPGTIIAGAVQDEASSNLSEAAIVALNRIGVTTDLRGRFRWSHTFIGVVGAPPASALEAATLLQPATVHVGVAVDAPAVYGGIGRVEFQGNR